MAWIDLSSITVSDVALICATVVGPNSYCSSPEVYGTWSSATRAPLTRVQKSDGQQKCSAIPYTH